MIGRVGRRTAAPRWLLTLTAAALLWASLPVAAGTGTASERDGRDERGRAAGALTAPRTIIGPYRSEGQTPVAPGVVHDSGAFVTDTSAGPRVAHIVEVDPGDRGRHADVVASIDEVVAAAPVTVIDDRVAPSRSARPRSSSSARRSPRRPRRCASVGVRRTTARHRSLATS
jgi:hypothetical protein